MGSNKLPCAIIEPKDTGVTSLLSSYSCPFVFNPNVNMLEGGKSQLRYSVGSQGMQDDSLLALSLGIPIGPPVSTLSFGTSWETPNSYKETSTVDPDLNIHLHLGNKIWPCAKDFSGASQVDRSEVNLDLSLSIAPAKSGITDTEVISNSIENDLKVLDTASSLQLAGSASFEWKSKHLGPPLAVSPFVIHPVAPISASPSVNIFSTVITGSPEAQEIAQKQLAFTKLKTCEVIGCGKGARGASGRCISHGGGRRCERDGCYKGAEGRTPFCKAHGGGRRCQHLGCIKSAEGKTDFCIAHGGGKRCKIDGCTRAARGKSGLCIRHGGGKRCQMENCTKSAEGLSGLCISHGGGRRCQKPGCTKGAQGSTMFCKGHGGGKRCSAPSCTKGAEGSTPFCKGHGGGKRCSFEGGGVCSKSVHGGTLFCVRHGGGKRCAITGCTKSARGRTDYCVRHGGGKRCKREGCPKSAQGSTDFCKSHGGGKRCSWGQDHPKSNGEAYVACDNIAGGTLGLCATHSAQTLETRVHGGDVLGQHLRSLDSTPTAKKVKKSSPLGNTEIPKSYNDGLILSRTVDNSMTAFQPVPGALYVLGEPNVICEGRVHGGSLMSMFEVN